jgi:hypothetical protein
MLFSRPAEGFTRTIYWVCFHPLWNLRLIFPREVGRTNLRCVYWYILAPLRVWWGSKYELQAFVATNRESTLYTLTNYKCYFVAGSSFLPCLCLRHSNVNKHFEIPTVIFIFVFIAPNTVRVRDMYLRNLVLISVMNTRDKLEFRCLIKQLNIRYSKRNMYVTRT